MSPIKIQELLVRWSLEGIHSVDSEMIMGKKQTLIYIIMGINHVELNSNGVNKRNGCYLMKLLSGNKF